MSKEAVLFSIDVGSEMDQPYNEHQTKLKISLDCLSMTLQQKIFHNNTHEVGFCIFGDNEEIQGDGNSCTLSELGKPNLDLVRKVIQMSEATLNNDLKGGDIFKALEYCCNKMDAHCQNKKYNKRIFLFTCGCGTTEYTSERLETLAKEIQEKEIKVNIIPVAFMETYDIQTNTLQDQKFKETFQKINANLLMKLQSYAPGNIQIVTATLAIELYKKFRTKDTNPVAIFKGSLEIAPGLELQVTSFKSTRREKTKSLMKYDATVAFDPTLKQKEIINDITYTIQGDETGEIINNDNQTNAYYYGSHLIPINDILEKETKIHEEKNFKLLGFVEKAAIKRNYLLGQVEMVVPSAKKTTLENKKLFTALIYGMISLGRYALARYVPRNCQNGVNPRFVVLIPHRTLESEAFYLVDVPTVEDIRDYPFNSLKQANQDQLRVVGELIDRMNLCDQEGSELVKIERNFNPFRLYFYQCIFHRAFSNDKELPEIDPIIKDYINPEKTIHQGTKQKMKEIKDHFKLYKKQQKNKFKNNSRIIAWKNITDEANKLTTDDEVNPSLTEDLPAISKKFAFQEEEPRKIDPAQPIDSFRSMLSNKKEDLVQEAIQGMQKFIQEKCKLGGLELQPEQILACCNELRKGCEKEKQDKLWDSWLETISTSLGDRIYQRFIMEGFGYLTQSNQKAYCIPQHYEPVEIQMDDLD